MPFPKALARFNRRATNRPARRFAGRIPPFALVVHRGRRSGRQYRTPVMAFRSPGGLIIALTYGPGTDWARNVLAAGGCVLIHGGWPLPLTEPRLVGQAEAWPYLPAPVKVVLHLIGVQDYLLLHRDERASAAADAV